MGNELTAISDIVSNHVSNVGANGILMIKCGVLALKNTSDRYQLMAVEDGMFNFSAVWYYEKEIRAVCMELNPEEYPMAEAIHGK